MGPQSLEEPGDRIVSRKYDPKASPLLQLDIGPVTVKSPGSSSRFGQLSMNVAAVLPLYEHGIGE